LRARRYTYQLMIEGEDFCVEFRRAIDADYSQIVDLQLRNLDVNLSNEQKSGGFLSGYFEEPALRRMNEDMCVLVCAEGARVAGFIGLSSLEFNRDLGMPGALVAAAQNHAFDGRPLLQWSSSLCGPVCIEEQFRGIGLFGQLYEQIPDFIPQCDLAITSVSRENPRSIRAHEKVGMQRVFEFTWNNKTFVCLAKLIQPRECKPM
jgi:hypothetical protein